MSREYSEEEVTYFELKKSFEEEWSNFFDEEFRRSLGDHYNYQFMYQTGIEIEDFIKKHRSYYSFLEIAEHRLTGKKRNRKEPIKSRTDKLAVRLKTGLISEKGLGFSLDLPYNGFRRWLLFGTHSYLLA